MADTVSVLDGQGDNIGKMQIRNISEEAPNGLKQIRNGGAKDVANIIDNLVSDPKMCLCREVSEAESDGKNDILLLHQNDSPDNVNVTESAVVNSADKTVLSESGICPAPQEVTASSCLPEGQSECVDTDLQSANTCNTCNSNDALINDTLDSSNTDCNIEGASSTESSIIKNSSEGNAEISLLQGEEIVNVSTEETMKEKLSLESNTEALEKMETNMSLKDDKLVSSDGETKEPDSKPNTKPCSPSPEDNVNSTIVKITPSTIKDSPISSCEEITMSDIQITWSIGKNLEKNVGNDSNFSDDKNDGSKTVEKSHSEELVQQQEESDQSSKIPLSDKSSGDNIGFTSLSSESKSSETVCASVVVHGNGEQSGSVEAMDIDLEVRKVEQDKVEREKDVKNSLSEVGCDSKNVKSDTDKISESMEIDRHDVKQVSVVKSEAPQNHVTKLELGTSLTPSVSEAKGNEDSILNAEIESRQRDNKVLKGSDSMEVDGENSVSESKPDRFPDVKKLEKQPTELNSEPVVVHKECKQAVQETQEVVSDISETLVTENNLEDCDKEKTVKADEVDKIKSANMTFASNNSDKLCLEIASTSATASSQKDTTLEYSNIKELDSTASRNRDETDVKENGSELDDEIIFLDEKEKIVPAKTEKVSFKNILQFAKDSSISSKSDVATTKVESKPESCDLKDSEEEKKAFSDVKSDSNTFNKINNEIQSETNEFKADLEDRPTAVAVNTKKGSEREAEQIDSSEAQNDRKRSLSTEEMHVSKRLKLGDVDEKLKTGSATISDDISMEVLDSDDDLILAEDTPTTKSEGIEASEDNKYAELKADNATLELTSEALQYFITARVKAFFKQQKLANLEKLNRRTRSMQSGTCLWKETAQHLEKTVKDLTILNQKMEKRKAHANAVKSLSSRTIGIQVNEEKVKSVTAVLNENQKKTNPVATLSLPPSILLNPPPSQPPIRSPQIPTNTVNRPPVRHQSLQLRPQTNRCRPTGYGNVRQVLGQGLRPNIPAQMAQRQQRPTKTQQWNMQKAPPRSPAVPPPSNLIDLTDEEDTAKTTPQTGSRPLQTTQTVARPTIGAKNPGATWPNGCLPQNSVPAIVMGSNNQILQSTLPGSPAQLIQGSPSVGVSASQLQLVSLNNSVNASQGPALFALVPGSRPGAPANLPMTPGPSMTASNRVISQNTTQTVAAAMPQSAPKITTHSLPPSFHISHKHPAPLPPLTTSGAAPANAKRRPPKPGLKISRVSQGIVLSWNMPSLDNVENITSYQLFAYQETESAPPRSSLWKKVGDVKALPLPMACTLTQFQEGNKYHFAVRAVDQFGRYGQYSDPSTIFLGPKP